MVSQYERSGVRCIYFILTAITLVILSCTNDRKYDAYNDEVKLRLNLASKQLSHLLDNANLANKIPRTTTADGKIHWAKSSFDWTEGFFPGTCWYLYAYTHDTKWKVAAEKFQAMFESHKLLTTNHDLGFVFNCSYGNGYNITHNPAFKNVMIEAADSLSKRFNQTVGCIKSWDVDRGWQKTRGWEFPVIIDNMMNLELLFKASEFTGNPKYENIAITHANTTLNHHFREDNSSVHVVDYNPETGEVRSKQTAQGFADNSSWARGQAWGLYGYTVCYRYTKNETYLEHAKKIANYIINHHSMPKDGIPYWDYNAPNIPNEPRDVSAAAITVSALLELDGYATNVSYASTIKTILNSLSTNTYTANLNTNNNFVLKHSVGSIPHNNEIDVPLNYADYYYIEALTRYLNI